jgi:hypothetical protein
VLAKGSLTEKYQVQKSWVAGDFVYSLSAPMHYALEESPVQDLMRQFRARPSISLAKVVLLVKTMSEIGKWMFKNSESLPFGHRPLTPQ